MNKALLVGINTYPAAPLSGCVNDVTDVAHFIVAHSGFQMGDVRLLVDDRATKDAIIKRLTWLVSGARKGDRLLFYYSGHGAECPVRNPQGDVDVIHDCICPVDFDWTDEHAILDTDFKRIFSSVPEGVEFIWGSDSCFSGGLLVQNFGVVEKYRKPKFMPPPADIMWRISTAKQKKLKSLGFAKAISRANVALISGCKADEESTDAYINNRFNGAMTWYLLQELNKKSGLKDPLTKVVLQLAVALKASGEYTQTPLLQGNAAISSRSFLTL